MTYSDFSGGSSISDQAPSSGLFSFSDAADRRVVLNTKRHKMVKEP